MHVRFLLGPTGSGKTLRCLGEVRAALHAAPDGAPLVFLMPKQATFQLERQFLEDPALSGWTRLHILSFERLAEWVLDQLGRPQPRLLDGEGRLMVLRALLAERHGDLNIFRATARLPGFARQLSELLRELQRRQLTPDRLIEFRARSSGSLADKLADLALMLRVYQEFLSARGLHDVDTLPDLAISALREAAGSPALRTPHSTFRIASLWLDGFAEMTPQELELLAALTPRCDGAMLAFCLEDIIVEAPSWLSPWAVVGQTFLRCRDRLAREVGITTSIENLPV